MKEFKSLIVVKQPIDLVWVSIRDKLPELGAYLSDIDEILVEEREELADGNVLLVNVWKAKMKIPAMIKSIVDPGELSWTDEAEWIESQKTCHWKITPHFFKGRIQCQGTTDYQSAMGGRGTKICFSGQLTISTEGLKGVPSYLENKLSVGIESLVSTVIPKNFRKITQAVPELL